jgi:hypothetical protein
MTRQRPAVTIAVSRLEAPPMMVWGSPLFGCALLASAVMLRRWPFAALAVALGGSAASAVLEPDSARLTLIVVVCVVGLEVC